jgi:hypothetical protein
MLTLFIVDGIKVMARTEADAIRIAREVSR